MKKILPIVLAFLIGAAAGILFVLPGFHKRTDIDLQKFSVSDDGSIVTVQTFPEGSMGFIRAMEAKQFGDEIHCSFYGSSSRTSVCPAWRISPKRWADVRSIRCTTTTAIHPTIYSVKLCA